jgi:hypothetical protein
MAHAAPPVTPLARPIRLAGAMAVTDAEAAARLHPLYEGGLQRVPRGAIVSRGLPFHPPGEDTSRRWVPLDESVRIDLEGVSATWLVLLHFCDAWRDRDGLRPEGAPVGWVVPVGEPLLRAAVSRADGSRIETTLRRRFEVNEGIIGWGSMAFLALPHLVESPLDWRGPHPRQDPGRYAAAGHAGPLTILPGTWGGAQTGVTDHVPSATDELMLWLFPLDVRGQDGAASRLEAIEFSPLPGEGRGRTVILAAITAFSGPSSPLRWLPRRAYRLSGSVAVTVGVDMGLIARRTSLTPVAHVGSVFGWGVGDRTNDPLFPKNGVGKGWDVAHMNSGADHRSALYNRAKSLRDERAYRCKQDCRVQSDGRRLIASAYPFGAQFEREFLRLLVTRFRECKNLPALMPGQLDQDVRGRAESVKAKPSRVARHLVRSVADQPRAE